MTARSSSLRAERLFGALEALRRHAIGEDVRSTLTRTCGSLTDAVRSSSPDR